LQDASGSDIATGMLQQFTVTETRSPAPGWSISGQESDFIGTRGAHPRTIPGTALGWIPIGSLSGGATLGPAVVADHPSLGTKGALLAAAAPGSGGGTSTLSADLTLKIPASAVANTYVGTLTITCIETGPLPASATRNLFPQAS
jgi:hypothetical protein